MKRLNRQLKLEALVMIYVEICKRGEAPIYCTKTTDINIENLAITGFTMFHIVIVIQKVELKLMQLT